MLHKMYCIFDTKAEAYLQPFFLPNDAVAVRAITDCVRDPSHSFSAHPEDYVLFALGTFSDHDCSFSIAEAPSALARCIELVGQSDQQPSFEETEK